VLKGLRAVFAGLLASVAGTGDARSTDLRDPVLASPAGSHRAAQLLGTDPELDARLRGLTGPAREKTPLQMACALSSLTELERTTVVTSWALSPRREQRLALARACAYPFEALGLRSALEQLAQDEDPIVREAIASALTHRAHAVELDLTLEDGVLRPRGTLRRGLLDDPA
jgi:hypothetical protein